MEDALLGLVPCPQRRARLQEQPEARAPTAVTAARCRGSRPITWSTRLAAAHASWRRSIGCAGPCCCRGWRRCCGCVEWEAPVRCDGVGVGAQCQQVRDDVRVPRRGRRHQRRRPAALAAVPAVGRHASSHERAGQRALPLPCRCQQRRLARAGGTLRPATAGSQPRRVSFAHRRRLTTASRWRIGSGLLPLLLPRHCLLRRASRVTFTW
mmetsp:Transcript_26702/g.67264  ORF Transcript_26702/g.67264 Transcript_26702/m.67264 type:complete len:210 (-) Transcript_26702:615-1244(-)